MRTPLRPPPPYCTALPFQVTGKLTWKLIGGAAGSMGATEPRTLQNAGIARVCWPCGLVPAATDGIITADANLASPLGRPMRAGPIAHPFRAEHAASLSVTSAV